VNTEKDIVVRDSNFKTGINHDEIKLDMPATGETT